MKKSYLPIAALFVGLAVSGCTVAKAPGAGHYQEKGSKYAAGSIHESGSVVDQSTTVNQAGGDIINRGKATADSIKKKRESW